MHVPFCIFVRRADHLREVDDDRLPAVPSDEDVELVEVAVDEPRTRAGIVRPGRGRPPREALYGRRAPGDVLDDDLRPVVLHLRVVVTRVENERDIVRGGVGEELGEESDGLDARVAVLIPD